jgi:hypothetical protein
MKNNQNQTDCKFIKDYTVNKASKSFFDLYGSLDKQISQCRIKLLQLDEKVNMMVEDNQGSELTLRELIKSKEEYENYRRLISTTMERIIISSYEEQFPKIEFNFFNHYLKNIHIEKIAESITSALNISIKTNEVVIYNILVENLGQISKKFEKEEYFFQLTQNCFKQFICGKYSKLLFKERLNVEV